MDDLFSLPKDMQGGAIPVTRSPKARARAAASSFRAAWTPVQTPDFGEVPEAHHPGGGVPAMLRRADASPVAARVAVLDPPRALPLLDLPHLPQPVVDAATAVRQRMHVTTTWDRILQRG
ncbi:MAG: hypothetical protein HY873_14165, partial [Chloroflexi bacterium]|nr:hypothetical protein [Chloroflexota bacterium]